MAKQVYLVTSPHSDLINIIREYVALGIDYIEYKNNKEDDATFKKHVTEIFKIIKKTNTNLIIKERFELVRELHMNCVYLNSNDKKVNLEQNKFLVTDDYSLPKNRKLNANLVLVPSLDKKRIQNINQITTNIAIGRNIDENNSLQINPTHYMTLVSSKYLMEASDKEKALWTLKNSDLRYVDKILTDEKIAHKDLKIIEGGSSNNLNATFVVNGQLKIIKIFYDLSKIIPEYKHFKNQNIEINKGKNFVCRNYLSENKTKLLSINDIKQLINNIEEFHKCKPIGSNKFDYDAYDDLVDENIKEKYLQIKAKLKSLPQVQIHGDINKKNILKLKDDVILIDFEWASTGAAIIDYAYMGLFIPETLPYIKKSNLDDAMFFIKHHTIGWATRTNTIKSKKLINWINRNL